MSSLLSNKYNDTMNEPMFFGIPVNLQRFDKLKYPVFRRLDEHMTGLFWQPKEISNPIDKADFEKLSELEQKLIIKNISYQELMDSVQGRAPLMVFGGIVSLPELEGCLITWTMFEKIHSESYSEALRKIFDNPSEIFDNILNDYELCERVSPLVEKYDILYKLMLNWELKGRPTDEATMRELKKALYLCMISVNILEGVRFYVSFICTFIFAERGFMSGLCNIVRLIARDEGLHMQLTQYIIKLWNTNPDEGMQEIIKECRDEAVALFSKAYEEECSWVDYLFIDGQSIIGLDNKVLKVYLKYLINKRMNSVYLPGIFKITKNPLLWSEKYFASKYNTPAPQETQITSYTAKTVSNKLDHDMFKDI